MLLLLTLRGTPTLYYGDELGMEDVPVPPERAQDPWGQRVPGLNLGRDPERAPMPWANEPNAGFCPPNVEPWLPITPDLATVNVASQRDDPASMLSLTRRLLGLRRGSRALTEGSYRSVDWPGVSGDCFVFVRETDSERLVVALNFSDRPQRIALPAGVTAMLVLSTRLDRAGGGSLSTLELGPHEGCIYRVNSP